jgi:hypothetical protein
METSCTAISLAERFGGYCWPTGNDPAVTWETALSRIWEALRQAERQRSGGQDRASTVDRAGDRTQEDADRRENLRHVHRVSLLIYGSDSDKQPFHEEAETIDAHENGCSVTLETVVARGQRLFLTNMRNQAEQECRVIHVGRRAGGKARIGIEFVKPAPQFWRPS